MTPITALLRDIKISHTIFAMPFAILGAVMAGTMTGVPLERLGIGLFLTRYSFDSLGLQILLVLICMILARTSAMLSNRMLDRHIDKINPRTAGRALPSGKASLKTALILFFLINLLFVSATSVFGLMWDNWLPLAFSIPVLLWLDCYPLFKRFTWMCHIFLGSSLALSPIAAAIAINPSLLEHLPIWLLSAAVLCWVAGFDIIYALQDVECDVRDNLKSMPASFGIRPAMLISQVMHCGCVALLFSVSMYEPRFGTFFLIAVVVISFLLIVEHSTVKRWGTTKIALTFFTLNGIVSVVLGVAGVVDLLS